jgi:hypothetical protein
MIDFDTEVREAPSFHVLIDSRPFVFNNLDLFVPKLFISNILVPFVLPVFSLFGAEDNSNLCSRDTDEAQEENRLVSNGVDAK